MAVDKKIIDRLENLLRLASPESGTTDHEREVAALEIVRLMVKHSIGFGEAPERQTSSRGANGGGASRVSSHAWVLSKALQHCSCSNCFSRISPGDIIWIRVMADRTVQFRHDYGPCAVR